MQDQNTPLVSPGEDGSARTTSLIIATGTGNEHASVLKLVRNNIADFEEFGPIGFEIRKGQPLPQGGFAKSTETAVLNEEQATLLMTYLRNSDIVRDFKKRLVREFYAMRKASPALQGPELMAAGYVEAMKALGQRDARIHQLEQKATADAPKVTYVDTFVADADCLTFSTVASTLNMQESKLRELLIAKNWIYCQQDSRWSDSKGKKVIRNRYSEKADKKRYFRRIETHEAPRFRGSEVMHTLKVTPQGAEAIARLVSKEQAA